MTINDEVKEIINIIIEGLKVGNFGMVDKALESLEKIINNYIKYMRHVKRYEERVAEIK